jgi:hypothetical protein
MSGRLRLVITRTFPAALEIGIAQHTIRGEERPFVPMIINEEARWYEWICDGFVDRFNSSAKGW